MSTDTRDLLNFKEASTQTDAELETDLEPTQAENVTQSATINADKHEECSDHDSTSSGSWTDTYVDDPDYTGPCYHSQPCLVGKHGASYTPPGWKRVTVKRKRLYSYVDDNDDRDPDQSDKTQ